MANAYFMGMLILEMVPQLQYGTGVPDLIMPIAFVVGLSMGKDIYEDVMRHKQDNEENNRKCEVG
jgi:phospholipid-translocating ATPase